MVGKRVRMARLFRDASNRTCLFPIDHGLTIGPSALVDPYRTIGALLEGDADGIIVHKGVLQRVGSEHRQLARGTFVLHISASTVLDQGNREKCVVSGVEDALRLGAAAVSVHINLGVRGENRMLADLAEASSKCIAWGMPLLAMMYVHRESDLDRGPSDEVEHIAHAARVAEELGADIVKVNMPADAKRLRDVVRGVSIPVVVAGGAKSGDPRVFLASIAHALDAGAAGVAVGRNVFQAANVTAMASAITRLVHGQAALDECVASLG